VCTWHPSPTFTHANMGMLTWGSVSFHIVLCRARVQEPPPHTPTHPPTHTHTHPSHSLFPCSLAWVLLQSS
jgi:hypothetical protein